MNLLIMTAHNPSRVRHESDTHTPPHTGPRQALPGRPKEAASMGRPLKTFDYWSASLYIILLNALIDEINHRQV